MGMTILQARQRLHEKWMELTKDGKDEEMMQALSIADTVLGNYDESLNADMVAILEDLKQDFIAEAYGIEIDCTDYVVNVADIDKVIYQKINTLRNNGNEEDEKVNN